MSDQHPTNAEIDAAEAKAKALEQQAKVAIAAAEKARAEAHRVVRAAGQALRLTSNYSFHDDAGVHRAWAEGDVVSSIDDVRLLLTRKAPVERIEITAIGA